MDILCVYIVVYAHTLTHAKHIHTHTFGAHIYVNVYTHTHMDAYVCVHMYTYVYTVPRGMWAATRGEQGESKTDCTGKTQDLMGLFSETAIF